MNDYPFPNHPTAEEEAERVEYLMEQEQIVKGVEQYERNSKTNQGTE